MTDEEELEQLKQALDWCVENQAKVEFTWEIGSPRIRVSTGGYPMLAARLTFVEAVGAARNQLELMRKAKQACD